MARRVPAVAWQGCESQGSERVGVGLAGADPHRVIKPADENLAVADLPGPRRRRDGLDDLIGAIAGDRHFNAELGQEADGVLGAAVDLAMSLLTAVAFDLGDGHAV